MPNFGTFIQTAGVLYDTGSGIRETISDGNSELSNVLNFADFGTPGEEDFAVLGPGSQCWYLGYALSVEASLAPPTDVLGASIEVGTSFDRTTPFVFATTQQIVLPVYDNAFASFQGSVRMEGSAGLLTFFNNTGIDLVVSWSFWGKSF